ncbi:zinc transporter ZntB [Lentibacter sp.]|uniref:zinc transporter ZntB n=1 Tax=Lentibacter sp. TaxID=2024994 RepID=UPI003F6D1384
MPNVPTAFGYAIGPDRHAVVLGGKAFEAAHAPAAGGYLWRHVQGDVAALRSTLHGLQLDDSVVTALTAEETRPRCTPHGAGAILVLRGVNLTEGAEPDDMISLRLWVEAGQVVSCGVRELKALGDVTTMVEEGRAPLASADMVAALVLRLADRAEPIVAELNEKLDSFDDALAAQSMSETRRALAEIRQMATGLRRYMFPQRDALTTFEVEAFDWVSREALGQLREATDRLTRLCEELDAIRDRAQIVQDQVMDARAEQMNTQMFVLTIVSAFFLPIGFLTGLLGINVGGVPLSDSPNGFAITCGAIVAVLIAEYALFKKMKLF